MRLKIEDMDRLVYLSVPEISPDSEKTAFVSKKASDDSLSFCSDIIISNINGNEKIVLEDSDLPKYSPDGSMLAYLCQSSGEEQIWIKDASGSRQITDLVHGVSDFIWAPDGEKLFFTAKLYGDELDRPFGEMSPEEKKAWHKRKEDEPVVVEELIYKLDEVGLFDGSHYQLGCTDLHGNEKLLTSGSFDHILPAISRNGEVLYYYAKPYGSIHRLQPQLMAISLSGKALAEAEEPEEKWPCDTIPASDGVFVLRAQSLLDDSMAPVPLNDGTVLVLGYIKSEEGYSLVPIVVDTENHTTRPLFESACPTEEVNNAIVGRNMVGRETPAFRASKDGSRLYFTSVWMGMQHLYCYSIPDKSFSQLTSGSCSVQEFSKEVNGKLAILKGTISRPAELYIFDTSDMSELGPLTDVNGWLDEYELPEPVEMNISSSDKKATIHGRYIKPCGIKEGERVPAVLDVHGGPDCSYSTNFWFEFQYLASNGIAVVYCDPRGSIGYGKEFHSGESAYGGEAACDLMAFLDAVCDMGFIDRAHCGVTGGSYGGFMTNWLISNTDRFAAAVTQRTLCNLSTSYGTGDMGFVTGKAPEPMSRMLKKRATGRATTVRLVDKVNTPLLLLHGVNDYRCSFEQAEQFYIAMKERRPSVPVRLVAFPGQNHGLTRSGQPWAQKAHLKELTDWFVKYLSEEPLLSASEKGPAWKDAASAPKGAADCDPTSTEKEEQ